MVGARIKKIFLLSTFAVCLCATADAKGLVGFKFESDRSDCLYKLGDEAVITVTATNGAGEAVKVGSARVEWNNYGRRNLGVVTEWNFAEKNPLVVRGSLDKPGFMRLRVRGKDCEGAQIGRQTSERLADAA